MKKLLSWVSFGKIDYPRQADVDQPQPASNATTTTTTTTTTSTTIINPSTQLKSIQVPIGPPPTSQTSDHNTVTTYRVNSVPKSIEAVDEEEINFSSFKAAPNVTIRNSSYKNNLDSSTLYLLSKDITKQIELDMERSNLNEEEEEEDEINLDDDDDDDEDQIHDDDDDEDDMHNRAYREEEELSAIAINTNLIHHQNNQTRSIMIHTNSNKTNGSNGNHKNNVYPSSSVNTNSQADGDLLSCSSISSSKSSSLKSNVLTPTRTSNNVVVVHHQSSTHPQPPQTNSRPGSQFSHQFNNSTNSIVSNGSSINPVKSRKPALSSTNNHNTSTITASTTNSINDDASEVMSHQFFLFFYLFVKLPLFYGFLDNKSI